MNGEKRRIVVLASGTRTGGGSGFEWLVEGTRMGVIPNAEVVAVVSNQLDGGVARKAARLEIPFRFIGRASSAVSYERIAEEYSPDLTCLSGWLLPVCNPDPAKVINIHPGPLPEFGGTGKYGHYVHEAVMAAYHRSEITETEVTMHFVTEGYDEGPVFFQYPVAIRPDDTPETLGARVNEVEHAWQAYITGLVLDEKIWYNALNGNVVVQPETFRVLHQFFPEAVVVV